MTIGETRVDRITTARLRAVLTASADQDSVIESLEIHIIARLQANGDREFSAGLDGQITEKYKRARALAAKARKCVVTCSTALADLVLITFWSARDLLLSRDVKSRRRDRSTPCWTNCLQAGMATCKKAP